MGLGPILFLLDKLFLFMTKKFKLFEIKNNTIIINKKKKKRATFSENKFPYLVTYKILIHSLLNLKLVGLMKNKLVMNNPHLG
jgi:hypothetical protein